MLSFVFSCCFHVVSCTEAKPAHEVSSGEDEESEGSNRTVLKDDDRIEEPSPAKRAEKPEKKRKKKRARSSNSRSRTRSRDRGRSQSSKHAAPAAPAASATKTGTKPKESKLVLDKEKLAKLEEKVRKTKEQIHDKEQKNQRQKQEKGKNEAPEATEAPEDLKRLAEEKAKPAEAPKADWRGQHPQGQQCFVCGKTLRSSSDFALSQHLWSVHPEHPEAQKRSQDYKITLKEREKSQPRENWQSQARERSQSKGPKNQNWYNKRRDDSRPRSKSQRSPGSRSQQRDRSPRRQEIKSSSGYSRRRKSSTGTGDSPNMLAEFFRTTRQLSRKS